MAAPASTSSEAAKGMIRLHLHVHDHHFIQPCKEGNQTVKWLSMVASQRFAMTQTPRGRVRQREGPKSPRGDFVPSGLTSPRGSPRNSPRGGEELKQDELKLAESSAAAADDWTSEEQFIHPETKIRDVFADGEHVIIRLNVAGGRGTRVSRFHAYAFQNSETAVKRRVNMESEHKIVREVEEGRALAATLAKIKHNASLLFSGADQMDNPHLVETTDELRHAFDIEWDMMEIQHFVDNAAELEAIQCCMEQYYTPIRAVFKHYSALGLMEPTSPMAKLAHDGSSLSDTRMSFLELSHFCQKVGILDETLNEASLRKIFRWVDTDMSSSKKGGAGGAGSRRGGGKSTSSGGFKNGRDHALHRPEFMEALIHIAMSKYRGRFDNSPALQFQELVHVKLAPYIKTLVRNDGREALLNDDMTELFLGYIDKLKYLYYQYANANHSKHADATTLDALEFEMLCTDAEIVGETVTAAKVKDVFIDSQNEDLDEKGLMRQDFTNLTKMIFVEFIESMIYLGEAFVPEGDNHVTQVRVVLEKMSTLAVSRGYK